MKKKIVFFLGILAISSFLSVKDTKAEVQPVYCYWTQIGHASDWSYIIMRCYQTIYPNPEEPVCTCGSGDEHWYL